MRRFERHGILPSIGDGETERRTFPGLRRHPDTAAVAFDDFLAQRQPDASPGIFLARMQTLEDPENALEILRLDADAIVAHRELPLAAATFHLDVHLRRTVTA